MKNRYEAMTYPQEDYTEVYIPFKGEVCTLIIDTKDLATVSQAAHSWGIYTDRQGREFARADKASGQVMAHKLLYDIPKGCKLEWLSGNTLDLRRKNLNMVQPDGTVVPLLIPEPAPEEEPYTHTSNVLCVYFHKASQKWHAAAFYEGKRYSLGYQPDTPEGKAKAIEIMNEFRANGPKVKKGAN
ncbi:MAG: hypothetical protein NHB14_20940 [Desulfosporosinus sp.]|nr:hypothetical protein [Desulfosporosinus sp.]